MSYKPSSTNMEQSRRSVSPSTVTDLTEGGHLGAHGRLVAENGALLDGVVEPHGAVCAGCSLVQGGHL